MLPTGAGPMLPTDGFAFYCRGNRSEGEEQLMAEPVRVERRDAWRILAIERPEKMNALDLATLECLHAELGAAEADPACRAVILTGSGRAFCAGADLTAQREAPGARDLGHSIETTWNPLVRRLAGLAVPTIAAVNGVAAGAGANLALGCDIVLAARSARFIQAFIRIGLVPDCGGTFHLPRLVGAARARALAMLAEPVEAAQAEAWGMIWRAVDDAALMAEAEAMAARLAALPTAALVRTRRALLASGANGLDAQLDLERDLQRESGYEPDHAEGVNAFRDKRAPVFAARQG